MFRRKNHVSAPAPVEVELRNGNLAANLAEINRLLLDYNNEDARKRVVEIVLRHTHRNKEFAENQAYIKPIIQSFVRAERGRLMRKWSELLKNQKERFSQMEKEYDSTWNRLTDYILAYGNLLEPQFSRNRGSIVCPESGALDYFRYVFVSRMEEEYEEITHSDLEPYYKAREFSKFIIDDLGSVISPSNRESFEFYLMLGLGVERHKTFRTLNDVLSTVSKNVLVIESDTLKGIRRRVEEWAKEHDAIEYVVPHFYDIDTGEDLGPEYPPCYCFTGCRSLPT
jgi:hypothetical protein